MDSVYTDYLMRFFPTIFSPKKTKFDLIRELIKERFLEDPLATSMGSTLEIIDQQPNEILIGTPEGTVVTIIESYLALRDAGTPLAETILTIEQYRNKVITGEMPLSASLNTYIKYRVKLEHGDGPPISWSSIGRTMIRTMKFFKPDSSKMRKS